MSENKNVKIPDEAVEEAAKAAWEDAANRNTSWEEAGDTARDIYRRHASAVLHAAAPHIVSEAQASAWYWGVKWARTFDGPLPECWEERNPYRPAL